MQAYCGGQEGERRMSQRDCVVQARDLGHLGHGF